MSGLIYASGLWVPALSGTKISNVLLKYYNINVYYKVFLLKKGLMCLVNLSNESCFILFIVIYNRKLEIK